jgi:hypothetical protein
VFNSNSIVTPSSPEATVNPTVSTLIYHITVIAAAAYIGYVGW